MRLRIAPLLCVLILTACNAQPEERELPTLVPFPTRIIVTPTLDPLLIQPSATASPITSPTETPTPEDLPETSVFVTNTLQPTLTATLHPDRKSVV